MLSLACCICDTLFFVPVIVLNIFVYCPDFVFNSGRRYQAVGETVLRGGLHSRRFQRVDQADEHQEAGENVGSKEGTNSSAPSVLPVG